MESPPVNLDKVGGYSLKRFLVSPTLYLVLNLYLIGGMFARGYIQVQDPTLNVWLDWLLTPLMTAIEPFILTPLEFVFKFLILGGLASYSYYQFKHTHKVYLKGITGFLTVLYLIFLTLLLLLWLMLSGDSKGLMGGF